MPKDSPNILLVVDKYPKKIDSLVQTRLRGFVDGLARQKIHERIQRERYPERACLPAKDGMNFGKAPNEVSSMLSTKRKRSIKIRIQHRLLPPQPIKSIRITDP